MFKFIYCLIYQVSTVNIYLYALLCFNNNYLREIKRIKLSSWISIPISNLLNLIKLHAILKNQRFPQIIVLDVFMKVNNPSSLMIVKQRLQVLYLQGPIRILLIFPRPAFRTNLTRLMIFCVKNIYWKEKLYKIS